ncbi:hypothetical protein GCM10009539_32380 [Cryptosporangium japonicum]|uniref:Transposase n=1 Tax=Cryptosporangium japonicum TaxID=80872 RepID=A0ABN0UAW3_9ACTN
MANRPGKCIKWSVAIDPVTAIFIRGGLHPGLTARGHRDYPENANGEQPNARETAPTTGERRCEKLNTQWNESPQAQDPVAFGLSIVKPCFSIVSTKSIVAPPR